MAKIILKNEGYDEFLKGKLAFRREFFSGEDFGFVTVYFKDRRIGYGYINKRDKYPLRIYSRDIEDFREALKENILSARRFREDLGYGNVYRLVYSDADWLPGLVIDRYNDIFVVVYNSFLYSKNISTIKDVLTETFGEKITIYDKIKERFIYGNRRETIIDEGNAKFIVNIEGQKTGFYLDQRENRLKFYEFLNGNETVLDTFCYSGGFGIHALLRGCEVTFLEKSKQAVELLKRNFELNKVSGKIIRKDFFKVKINEKFDIVLADPPNYSEVMSRSMAFKNYYLIARKCLEFAKEIFVYSICDPNVDYYQMISLIQKAGRDIGKDPRVFDITFQSRDHPVTHPSLLYLKTVWVIL